MSETVFQESAAKVAIGFLSQIKIFENTACGHVTEVPNVSHRVCQKKVSGNIDTIIVAIFVFSLNCACTEFIPKYALTWKYVSMNF